MAVEIANAVLNITPSLQGMSGEISRQLRGVNGRSAGAGLGNDFASGFKGAAAKLTGIVAGAFAGIKIKDFAVGAISQASDMAEVGTKLQAIYGDAASDIEAFASKGAKSLGQTSLQAKNAAATFGTFGKAAGLSAKENAAFSTQLATLATDMASFSNTTPEQAIEALGAGLRGESEPLRQYGVLLDDASLRQEALSMGLITTTKEALTPQQKVLASHALIMKQTTDAQGDFARTSGGLANQQRILAAQWEDSKGKLGAAFLPGVTAVVSALNEKLGPAIDGIVAGLPAFTDAVRTQFDKVKGYATEAWSILSGQGFQGGNGLEEDSAIVDFLFSLRDFGLATFDKLRDIWDKLWAVAEKMWPHIQSIASSLGDAIKTLGDNGLWFGLLDVFDKLTDLMNDYLVPAFDWLARFMRENPDSVVAFVAVIGTAIAATKLWALAQAALNFILTANPIGIIVVALAAFAAAVVWAYNNVEWFRDLVDGAWDVISTAVSWAWENVIKPVLGYLWDRITDLGGSFQMLWETVQNVWTWISDKVTAVWNWLRDWVFTPLGDAIAATGRFFSDLWTKVQEVWTWISDKITSVWNWLRDWVFAPLKTGIDSVGQFFSDLWGTVQDVWTWISTKITEVWNWINANVFAPLILGINTIMTWMANLWTTVEGIWNKISGFFSDVAKGISDAVETVKKAIKDISAEIERFLTERIRNWGGTDSGGVLGNINLGVGPGGARGTVVPGKDPGRRDNMLMPVRSEEAIMVPEFTHEVGGAPGVFALNRLAEAGRLGEVFGPGMARGGVVGQKVHDVITKPVLALLERVKTQAMTSGGVSEYGPENYSGNAINTQAAIDFIKRVFGLTDVWGWRASGSVAGSDHPKGKAIDAMIPNYQSDAGIALGTRLADWFIQNPGNFGTKYVIWRDRINQGGSWSPYSHPGGNDDTLAHRNHVHISLLTGAAAAAGRAVGESLGGGGGGGVERWRGLGLEVLSAVGAYRGMNLVGNIDRMLNQIRTESSGNPNAINNWDINAQRGDPSIGLLQVIGSTFRNALRGTPFEYLIAAGQRDPRASMTASTLYSLNRYGSLDRAWRGVAYDWGGMWEPGTLGVNLLNRPEAVLTPPETKAYQTHAKALADGYSGMVPNVQVFIGERELTEIVDVRVDYGFDEMGRQLQQAGALDR